MGIHGLISFLKNSDENVSAVRPSHLSKFRGQKAAVDAYAWLHKGIFTCAQALFLNKPTKKYVDYCVKNIRLLQEYGIVPILVFDGAQMPFKIVEKQRKQNRDNARAQANDLIAMGRMNEAWSQMVQSIDVTHAMASELMKKARELGVESIVAPYEADAQLVFLQNQHIVDFIISEDSDLIIFGGTKIFFKLDANGAGEFFDVDEIEVSLKANKRLKSYGKYSHTKLIYAAIMSGCDYLKNLPGVGIIKAWKFMHMTENPNIRSFLKKIPSYLNLAVTIDENYIEGFIQAVLAFRCQLVFHPRDGKRVALNELSDDIDESDYEKFVNSFKSVEFDHLQLALGNIDYKNTKYDCFRPSNDSFLFNGVVSGQKSIEKVEHSPLKGFNVDGVYKRRRKLSIDKNENDIDEDLSEGTQNFEFMPIWTRETLQNDEDLTKFYRNVDTSPRLKSPVKEQVVEQARKRIKCKFLKHKFNQDDNEPLQRSEFFRRKQSEQSDSGVEMSQELIKTQVVGETDDGEENRKNLLFALEAEELKENRLEKNEDVEEEVLKDSDDDVVCISPIINKDNDVVCLSPIINKDNDVCISPVINKKESPIIAGRSVFDKTRLKEIQNVQKTSKAKKKVFDKRQPTLLSFFAKV